MRDDVRREWSRHFTGTTGLHYVDVPGADGAKGVILLVHGGHGDWRHWLANITSLSRHARIIAVDLPGFGQSDDPLELSLDGLVSPIAELVESLDLHQVLIVGFSFGALVATRLAARAGNRAGGLVLLSPAGFGRLNERVATIRAESGTLARAHGLEAGITNTLNRIMVSRPQAEAAQLVDMMCEMVRATRIKVPPISQSFRLTELVSQAGVPILVMLGDADPHHQDFLHQRIAELEEVRPGTRFIVIPGAAHWLCWDASELVTAQIIGFAALHLRFKRNSDVRETRHAN